MAGMKTPQFSTLAGFISTLTLAVWLGTAMSARAQTNSLRIGIFDSRAVAIAYAHTKGFTDAVKAARVDYDQAKLDNDDQKMKAIQDRMKLLQRRMHEQGFSTASVAGILAKVKDALPEIARQEGVQVIVSKWELNAFDPNVTVVDVTDDLVALFHPDEKTLKWVKSIQKAAPVSIDQITDDM